MAFDFALTKQNFKKLLSYNWQESPNKGWSRIKRDSMHTNDVTLMGIANKHFGYNFIQAESATLGKTYAIDPKAGGGFGQYGSKASAAFISAHGQVTAGHHDIDKTATALATHAFMQAIYIQTGVPKAWGDWSLGFNQSSFNVYKNPVDEQEAAVLTEIYTAIAEAFTARTGEKSGAQMSFSFATKQLAQLEIPGGQEMQKTFSEIGTQLVNKVKNGMKANPQQREVIRRKALGLSFSN